MADSFSWGSSIEFKLDGAAATIETLTDYVNSAGIQAAINVFDVTVYNRTGPGIQHGMANVTIPINFLINSTTEAIFGPLLNRTTTTKTAGFYNGEKWYTGEFLPDSVEFSGGPADLQVGSCNLVIHGVVTRTSVAPT